MRPMFGIRPMFAAFIVLIFAMFMWIPSSFGAGDIPNCIVPEVALGNQSDISLTQAIVIASGEISQEQTIIYMLHPTERGDLALSDPVPSYIGQAPTKDTARNYMQDIAGNHPPGLRSYHAGKIQGVQELYINHS